MRDELAWNRAMISDYFVVAFKRTEEGELAASSPIRCGTASEAAKQAEKLDRMNDGTIAVSSFGNFALNELANVKIIKGFGEIPSEIFDQLT
jgi:hypothetical protein